MVRSVEGGSTWPVARVSSDWGRVATSYPGVTEAFTELRKRPLNFSLKQPIAGNEEVAWGIPALVVLVGGVLVVAPLTQIINPPRCGSRARLSDPPCTHNAAVTHTQKSLHRLNAQHNK